MAKESPMQEYERYVEWKHNYIAEKRKKDILYMIYPDSWYWDKWKEEECLKELK